LEAIINIAMSQPLSPTSGRPYSPMRSSVLTTTGSAIKVIGAWGISSTAWAGLGLCHGPWGSLHLLLLTRTPFPYL